MPPPASEAEKTVALAFTLLHGNPPKSVKYRGRLFQFRDQKAKNYIASLEKICRAEFPHATRTRELVKRTRNRLLRYIMGIEDEEHRDANP